MVSKIINNNGYKYVTLNQDICNALDLDFGSWVKTTIKGKSVIITKATPPTKYKELESNLNLYSNSRKNSSNNLTSTHSKYHNPHDIKYPANDQQIRDKILQIISDDQVKSLTELLGELNVSDHKRVAEILKQLIEEGEIVGYEEADELYFSIKIK